MAGELSLDWQKLIVLLLVAACASHALWAVLPRALRQRLAAWRGKPQPVATGCGGCTGCGGKAAAPAPAGQAVIRIVRRPPAS